MLVMALGVSGSVVSVVRIVALRRADFEDFYTEHQTIRHYYFLNILENCIGIIAVSLAALRPLVKKVFGDSYARQTTRQLPTLETAHITKKDMPTGDAAMKDHASLVVGHKMEINL